MKESGGKSPAVILKESVFFLGFWFCWRIWDLVMIELLAF